MADRFVFYPAAASGSRPCRPAASGTGHCPALTISNAFLGFSSEVDTFLSIQLLVSAGGLGGSN